MYDGQKIVVSIEARMTSSRLPGKVLLPLAGKPALERQVERARRSAYVDEVVIATTVNRDDDGIEDLCRRIGCACFRGSEEDVLSRVLDAVRSVGADVIVELTGDCPLIDPAHIDHLVEAYFRGGYDYASNCVTRSFPDGFDVQVFPVSVLEQVDRLTGDSIDRVHVSYYIYSHPERFKLYNWVAEGEMFRPELGVTLDERSDYELLNLIFENLLREKESFSAAEVVAFLKKNPHLLEINKDVRRKAASEG